VADTALAEEGRDVGAVQTKHLRGAMDVEKGGKEKMRKKSERRCTTTRHRN
jgi:hypothetical protein